MKAARDRELEALEADQAAGLTCLCCGELERVELFEIWESGEFLLETCCEGLHEILLDEMNRDPEYRDELLRDLGAEAYIGAKLRRVADCDGQYRLDFNIELKPIERDQARAFVDEHHEHNKAPLGWRFGAGIWNGAQLIGVVMVGRPVARMIDASQVVEVNRLCLRRDVPRELRWNACSQAYGWAAREAKRRGFSKIITYTLESELGTSLKAAGWQVDGRTKGGSWHRPGRARADRAPTCRKVRWARHLAPAPSVGPVSPKAGSPGRPRLHRPAGGRPLTPPPDSARQARP
jgi:hypothetical protein